MTLVAFDSFENYPDIASLSKFYVSTQAVNSINSSGGRFNGPYIRFNGTGSPTLFIPFKTTSQTVCVGFEWYVESPLSVSRLVTFYESSIVHVDVSIEVTGQLIMRIAGSSVVIATSTNTLSANTWYFIEVKMKITNATTAGDVEVYVDGVLFMTTGVIDTQNGGTATCNGVRFGHGSSSGHIARYGSWYLTTGTTPLGDVKVSTLYANGNGAVQDFSASSGSDHSLLVDETSPNDDTDYVFSSTANHRELFTLSSLTDTPATIHAVRVNNYAKKTDPGLCKVKPAIRVSSANYEGTEVGVSDSYTHISGLWTTNPNTAAAWDAAGVNAIEAGILRTV